METSRTIAKAEKAIRDALLKMENSNEYEVVVLQTIDRDYWEFVLAKKMVHKEKTHYLEIGLYAITRATYPDSSLLIKVTNIAYSYEGMIEQLARVMDEMWNHRIL